MANLRVVLFILTFTLLSCAHPGQSPSRKPQGEALYTAQVASVAPRPLKKFDGPAMDHDGHLYAANFSADGWITRFSDENSSGTPLFKLPDDGVSAALRFDRRGNLFIADYRNHRIYRLSPGTTTPGLWAEGPEMNQPNDFTLADDGTLFLSDPSWAGPKKLGSIWKITPDRQVTRLRTGLKAVNGIDLSPDETVLYYTESISGRLFAIDLRRSADQPPTLIYQFEKNTVDGLRVDAAGIIYVTRILRGTVDRIDPASGTLLSRVQLQGAEPNNLAFGGADGRTVIVSLRDKGQLETFRVEVPGREWIVRNRSR